MSDDTPTPVLHRASPFDSTLCVFPVPISADGRKASISDGFYPAGDHSKRNGVGHRGVDIMYRRRLPAFAKAALNAPWGSKWYRMEPNTPALCVLPGRVFRCGLLSTGWHVVVEHAGGWGHAVHHLSSLADGIFTNASVEAGQPLGVIGHSPKGYQLVHLHLDVAYQGKWQDPAKWVHKWRHVPYAEAWQGHGHVSGDELLG